MIRFDTIISDADTIASCCFEQAEAPQARPQAPPLPLGVAAEAIEAVGEASSVAGRGCFTHNTLPSQGREGKVSTIYVLAERISDSKSLFTRAKNVA